MVDESETNKKVFCSILSTEMYYADRVQFKRYMVSNTIDPRFYKPIQNQYTADNQNAVTYSRPGPGIAVA